MRWMTLVLALALPFVAASQQKQECSGAPKPGTDEAGYFRFLRAIVEKSPAFAKLKGMQEPIVCSYMHGPGVHKDSYSRIKYVVGDMRLVVERHYDGACLEIRTVSFEFAPRIEREAMDLLRKDVGFYAPGLEKDVKAFVDRWDLSVRLTSQNGMTQRFDYNVSIGCSETEANAQN